MKKGILKDKVYGISPLGGNSVEGTGSPNAPIRSDAVEGVPLFYDPRVGVFISEQAISDLDDRDCSLDMAKAYRQEEQWRAKAGFVKS